MESKGTVENTAIESKTEEMEESVNIKEEVLLSAMKIEDRPDAHESGHSLYDEVMVKNDTDDEKKRSDLNETTMEVVTNNESMNEMLMNQSTLAEATDKNSSNSEEYVIIATENTLTETHRYFVIKPSTFDDIIRSHQGGPLSSSTNIMTSMKNALEMGRVTVFINISGTRFFQGYGTPKLIETHKNNVNDDDMKPVEGIGMDWKKLCHLSYDVSEEVINKMDGNRRINAALDGQEVSPDAAERLIELCDKADEETLDSCRTKLEQGTIRKRSASNDDSRKKKGQIIFSLAHS